MVLDNNKNNSFLNNNQNNINIQNERNLDINNIKKDINEKIIDNDINNNDIDHEISNINFNKIFFSENSQSKNMKNINKDKDKIIQGYDQGNLQNNQIKIFSSKNKQKDLIQMQNLNKGNNINLNKNELRKDSFNNNEINQINQNLKSNLNFLSESKIKKIKIENLENNQNPNNLNINEQRKKYSSNNILNQPNNNQLFKASSLSDIGFNANSYKLNNTNNLNYLNLNSLNNYNIQMNKFPLKPNMNLLNSENDTNIINKNEEKDKDNSNANGIIYNNQKSLKFSKGQININNILNSNENMNINKNMNLINKSKKSKGKNVNSNSSKKFHEQNFNNCEFNIDSLIENKNLIEDEINSLKNSTFLDDENVSLRNFNKSFRRKFLIQE